MKAFSPLSPPLAGSPTLLLAGLVNITLLAGQLRTMGSASEQDTRLYYTLLYTQKVELLENIPFTHTVDPVRNLGVSDTV